MKRLIVIFLVLFVSILFVGMCASMLRPATAGGLAAVSAGISEAIVEAVLLAAVVLIGWQAWRFARRNNVRPGKPS
jgi:hypothetical protein